MIFLSLFFSILIPNQSIDEVVVSFHELADRASETEFINTYKDSQNPNILGYVYALEMKQSEYSFNPYVKVRNFILVKKKLNQLIYKNPNSIHLRYIRLLLQENTPKFLGYNGSIEEDKRYLTKILLKKDNNNLSQYIYKNTSL
ncbi:MAG: hypothetical protein ACPHXR_00020 [Flavicella sp.]